MHGTEPQHRVNRSRGYRVNDSPAARMVKLLKNLYRHNTKDASAELSSSTLSQTLSQPAIQKENKRKSLPPSYWETGILHPTEVQQGAAPAQSALTRWCIDAYRRFGGWEVAGTSLVLLFTVGMMLYPVFYPADTTQVYTVAASDTQKAYWKTQTLAWLGRQKKELVAIQTAEAQSRLLAQKQALVNAARANTKAAKKGKRSYRSGKKALPTSPIGINTASTAQLMQLPGIGEALAGRILALRNQLPGKRFASVEQLLEVKGIGKKKMEKLRPYVKL